MSTELALANNAVTPTISKHWPLIEQAMVLPDLDKCALIPFADLPAAMLEAENLLAPCSLGAAQVALGMITGAYPGEAVKNPVVWAKEMAAVFQNYPAVLAFKAAEALIVKHKFVPNVAQAAEMLSELEKPMIRARAIILGMEPEYRRRSAAAAKQRELDEEKARFKRDHPGMSLADVYRLQGKL